MGVVFDKILGKLRQGLSKKEARSLESSFQKALTYVTLTNTQQPTLEISGGTHITLTAPIDSITLTATTAYHDEWICLFTVSAAPDNPVVDIPTTISLVGKLPSFEASKSYIISVRDNMLVAAEYTPGV